MKAITGLEWPWYLALASAGLALLGSCSAPPPPAPIRAPDPVPMPSPGPQPAPLPVTKDWRNIMPPPGTWRWAMIQGKSTAEFVGASGSPIANLTCDRSGAQVLLGRLGITNGQVAMGVTTTGGGNRPLLSNPLAGGPGWIVTAIPARDRVLDAIAFSRGRFLLDVAGLPSLALPSWPEVSRVIEDCR